jgi:hypothetical protein
MPGFTPEKEAELRASLQETFKEFDADGSGEVDAKEIKLMMTSLGLLIEPDTIKKMMEEADEDKSGEIDFEEFFKVMKKAAESGGSNGPFAALVNRKANSGPAIKWRTDKKGPGVTLDEDDGRKFTKSGDTWAVQLTDMYLRASKDESNFDAGDILLQCTKIGGECCIGLVAKNFEAGDWDENMSQSAHAIAAHFVIDKPGEVYRKKQHLGNVARMSKLNTGNVVQVEVLMKSAEVRMTILDKLEDGKVLSTISIDQLPATGVALAVGCGKGDFEFTILGTSCERTPEEEMATNETESMEKKNARENPAMAAAMAMA